MSISSNPKNEFERTIFWLGIFLLGLNCAVDALEGVPGLNSWGSFIDKNENFPLVFSFLGFALILASKKRASARCLLGCWMASLIGATDVWVNTEPSLILFGKLDDTKEAYFGILALLIVIIAILIRKPRAARWISG